MSCEGGLEVKHNSAECNYRCYGSILDNRWGRRLFVRLAIVYFMLGLIFNSRNAQEWNVIIKQIDNV